MINLINIELLKIRGSKTFWILLLLYIGFITPIVIGFEDILSSTTMIDPNTSQEISIFDGVSVFSYPDIWHNISYLGQAFQLLLGIVVITLVANEYRYGTLKQNLMDGLSRWDLVMSKEWVIVLLSVLSSIVLMAIVLIMGKNPGGINIWDGSIYILSYFLSCLLYLNFAFLLSVWIKRSGLTIGLLLMYSLILERLIRSGLPDSIANYFPMKVRANLIPEPFSRLIDRSIDMGLTVQTAGLSLVYIALFIGLIYMMMRKGKGVL